MVDVHFPIPKGLYYSIWTDCLFGSCDSHPITSAHFRYPLVSLCRSEGGKPNLTIEKIIKCHSLDAWKNQRENKKTTENIDLKNSDETKSGGLAGIRTLDKCLKRALLYQLSYQPHSFERRKLTTFSARRKGRF